MDKDLLVTKDCRHGRMTYLRADSIIGKSLELYGEWCEGEIILFGRLLHAGDVVIDVGANIGTHTLPLARLVGASGAVYAYEPQRMIYEILRKNVEVNDLPNVQLNWAAVGATDGVCHIPEIYYSAHNNFGEVSTGHGELEVPMVALDSLKLSRVNLIKIDVEGAEAEVLRGAASTIARQRPILYVENNKLEKSRELVELVRNMGYRLWWHLSARFNQHNFANNPHNAWPRNVDSNVVCLPQERAVPPWPLNEVRDGSELADLDSLIERTGP
jgi:FkbM family methyltransferase